MAELFAALSFMKGHGTAKLKTKIEVGPADESDPARVTLELSVLLTKKALTLEGPLADAGIQYDTSRVS